MGLLVRLTAAAIHAVLTEVRRLDGDPPENVNLTEIDGDIIIPGPTPGFCQAKGRL